MQTVYILDPCSRPANAIMMVEGFQPQFIRTCAMHTIHLGVLQLQNGSIFTLLDDMGSWISLITFSYYKPTVQLPLNLNIYIYIHKCIACVALVEGWFGDPGQSSKLPAKMIGLCGRFKRWASANQLQPLAPKLSNRSFNVWIPRA